MKSSDLGLFGDGNDGGVFEAAGNFAQLQRSVEDLCKDGGSWSAQTFRQTGEILSGPEAFLDFCFLKTRFTSSTQTLRAGRMVGKGGREGVSGGEGECVKCRSERVLGVSLAFLNR